MTKARNTLGRMSGVMKTAVRKAARTGKSTNDGRGFGLTMPQSNSERKSSRKNGAAPAAKTPTRKPAV